MRILLLLGFLTIFISCVFIFFAFDVLVTNAGSCFTGTGCDTEKLQTGVVFGFGVIFAFVMIDALVLYIIYKSWTPDLYK